MSYGRSSNSVSYFQKLKRRRVVTNDRGVDCSIPCHPVRAYRCYSGGRCVIPGGERYFDDI
jgi:hypothetical protein